MIRRVAPISVDQAVAFITLFQHGSLSSAAVALHLSEEGFRHRLLALEERLGAELYEKERGRRGNVRITQAGRLFFNKARQFVRDARQLTQLFEPGSQQEELLIAASQYLTYYVLIDAIRRFRRECPAVNVKIVTRSEQEILASVRGDSPTTVGICAPLEYPTDLICQRWFSLEWSLVVPNGHPLSNRSNVELASLAEEPLIVFEPGSTGRQHVLEAFFANAIEPNITLEATSTQVVVSMVEAGLGVAILPLLPSGVVTAGSNVTVLPLAQRVRPVETCILSRDGAFESRAIGDFRDFLLRQAT